MKPTLVCSLILVCIFTSCVRDTRDLGAARPGKTLAPSGLIGRSWGLCSLIGPRSDTPGIYGTDLGFTARRQGADKLTMLFGDTWVKPVDACQYPATTSDDFQALLPAERPARFDTAPPMPVAANSCNLLEYGRERADDPGSWPRLRLFPSPVAHSDDTVMDTSALRTPAAAFSDGQRMFAVFYRHDPAYCSQTSECPDDMRCSRDPAAAAAQGGKPLGECSAPFKLAADAAPDYCRKDADCGAGSRCEPAKRGVCLADKPFRLSTPEGTVVPTWYRDDPRRAMARTMYIAAAVWPERPTDYATLFRYPTNRFQNIALRSVAYFDPDHPERNDYRPGYHTLLVWGRATFVEHSGAQALPFLFYVPLAELQGEPEAQRWQPRYFAGYDARGNPAWSQRESDAQPIYGTEASVVKAGGEKIAWREPEFDYVEWGSVSYVAPLKRWVMLYGGDVPAFLVLDPETGEARKPVHLQFTPGAIHMRSAVHPWGKPHRADEVGWSSAEPLLTRTMVAPYLACGARGKEALPGCVENGDPHTPLDLVATLAGLGAKNPGQLADVAGSCVMGEFAYSVQSAMSGDPVGRLYAPNIIDEWTADLTPRDQTEHGPHSAEIYWNVSTWNPYQVILVKSRIDER
ncbi:MAG: hypothetical protein ABW321_01850 [Polyangiales bacterium]